MDRRASLRFEPLSGASWGLKSSDKESGGKGGLRAPPKAGELVGELWCNSEGHRRKKTTSDPLKAILRPPNGSCQDKNPACTSVPNKSLHSLSHLLRL